MNDYKDDNLKSAIMTIGVIVCMIIGVIVYLNIN